MAVAARIGDMIKGRYAIESVLGSGAMGVVCAAWDTQLERRVAIKCLQHSVAEQEDGTRRFHREARALARIDSEHVGRLLDMGLEQGRPFMVMEFLEGNDLEEELDRCGALPVPVALGYVLQAVEAVASAHAVGIVHRDLKPANLFLALRRDGSRVVKVLDFGISKWVGAARGTDLRLTQSTSLVGSPAYMAPEQVNSPKTVGFKADIWALGAVLFEALAARPPFVAESLQQLIGSLLTSRPPSLVDINPDVSPELDECVQKCLERDPDDRYASVAEFGSALGVFAPPSARVHVERASRVLSQTTARADRPPSTVPRQRDAEEPFESAPRQLEARTGQTALGQPLAAPAFVERTQAAQQDAPPATKATHASTQVLKRTLAAFVFGLVLVALVVYLPRQFGDDGDRVGASADPRPTHPGSTHPRANPAEPSSTERPSMELLPTEAAEHEAASHEVGETEPEQPVGREKHPTGPAEANAAAGLARRATTAGDQVPASGIQTTTRFVRPANPPHTQEPPPAVSAPGNVTLAPAATRNLAPAPAPPLPGSKASPAPMSSDHERLPDFGGRR